MEDIPNKVRDVLGIIVDVNLLTKDGKDYIEICANSNSYPVNYKERSRKYFESDSRETVVISEKDCRCYWGKV